MSAALQIAMPPPCKCTRPGSGPSASVGRLMNSVISLSSAPVMVVVEVVTPAAAGACSPNILSTAPVPCSAKFENSTRCASGASTVRGASGSRPSMPNAASALTMRGSARGSVPMVQSGSARRP
ncbi:Uncharacterised protein [Mycobacteroides abscessus subsp. abscessus]|nr:Uncharacterised protein [Mycobacteroides abscessus subsp. abscessus]